MLTNMKDGILNKEKKKQQTQTRDSGKRVLQWVNRCLGLVMLKTASDWDVRQEESLSSWSEEAMLVCWYRNNEPVSDASACFTMMLKLKRF